MERSNIQKIPGRHRRFASEETFPIHQSQNVNKIRSYYDGDLLDKRMSTIRESIVYIRRNWDEYLEMMGKLSAFLNEVDPELKREHDKQSFTWLDNCMKRRSNWGDLEGENFDMLRYYTSEAGHQTIFKFVNSDIFRCDDAVEDVERIRAAVFLIELINIELFNLCLKFPKKDNFVGTVYRGVGLTKDTIDDHKALLEKPIPQRFIAVPLSLQSTSLDFKKACEFMRAEAVVADRFPVMYRIHIIEMKPDLLKEYRRRFPQSTVSTICAVPIEDISDIEEEKEVILRGAFYQTLRYSDGVDDRGRQCDYIDLVAVNSNRDHISTAFLGELDASTRDLFGTMVGVSRWEFAVKFYTDAGLVAEAEAYREILGEAEKKLERLLSAK